VIRVSCPALINTSLTFRVASCDHSSSWTLAFLRRRFVSLLSFSTFLVMHSSCVRMPVCACLCMHVCMHACPCMRAHSSYFSRVDNLHDARSTLGAPSSRCWQHPRSIGPVRIRTSWKRCTVLPATASRHCNVSSANEPRTERLSSTTMLPCLQICNQQPFDAPHFHYLPPPAMRT
jgi:hypothetical protein